jgi:hypothetical protein
LSNEGPGLEFRLALGKWTGIMRGGLSGMSGYNTRVEYRGSAYIVQTQDKGLAVQYVESLIYKSGQLLTSKKTFYTPCLSSPNVKALIEQMMEAQHKKILEEIVEGKFD